MERLRGDHGLFSASFRRGSGPELVSKDSGLLVYTNGVILDFNIIDDPVHHRPHIIPMLTEALAEPTAAKRLTVKSEGDHYG